MIFKGTKRKVIIFKKLNEKQKLQMHYLIQKNVLKITHY